MARTSVTQSDAQKWADEAIAVTAAIPNFAYRGDKPLGKTWAIVMTKSRDSGLLEQSNFDKAREQLEEEHDEDVDVERASHWAVGWVDHLMVRALDRKGKATPAAKTFLEIKRSLDEYPVLDEEAYSKREYEATIDNIQSGRRDIDADTAAEIFTWLYDHDQKAVESTNDRGGEPDDDQIDAALRGIGRYDIVLGDLIEEIEVSWERGDAKWRHEDRDLADDRERWGDVQIAVIEAFKASARPLPNGRVIGRALPDGSVVLENPDSEGWRTVRVAADERQERLPGIEGSRPALDYVLRKRMERAVENHRGVVKVRAERDFEVDERVPIGSKGKLEEMHPGGRVGIRWTESNWLRFYPIDSQVFALEGVDGKELRGSGLPHTAGKYTIVMVDEYFKPVANAKAETYDSFEEADDAAQDHGRHAFGGKRWVVISPDDRVIVSHSSSGADRLRDVGDRKAFRDVAVGEAFRFLDGSAVFVKVSSSLYRPHAGGGTKRVIGQDTPVVSRGDTNLSGSDRASYDDYVRTGYQDCENVYDEEVFDVQAAGKELQRDVDALERSRGTMTREARRQIVRRKAENVIRESVTISDWQGYEGGETDLSREEAFEAWLTGWMNCALPRLTETLLEYTLGDAKKNGGALSKAPIGGRSMTYGTLPSIEAFEKAFEVELGEDERYQIHLSRSDSKAADGTSIGDGEYTADELYRGLEELVKKYERGREGAGDLASSILSTLGFEWI